MDWSREFAVKQAQRFRAKHSGHYSHATAHASSGLFVFVEAIFEPPLSDTEHLKDCY